MDFLVALVEGLASLLAGEEGTVSMVIAAVVAVFLAAHPLASFITKLTDTPKDNEAMAWWYKNVIEKLALVSGRAKQGNPDVEAKPNNP